MAPGALPSRKPPTSSPGPVALIVRGIALTLGLGGVFAAGYGALATWVVFQDWLPCVNPSVVGISDLPANYCEITSWPAQFGIGLGLIVGGLIALGAAIWLLRNRSGSWFASS